jgi:hypothetical protein
MTGMTQSFIESFITRSDLADMALLLWAVSASALLVVLFRESQEANRRSIQFMQEFLAELARFNRKIEGEDP